jgi:signal transduction histidine kinase
MVTWWQIVPPLFLLAAAIVLARRNRALRKWARTVGQDLRREEERLVGSLALAEETVHRILLTAEIESTLSRMATDCTELLDLAGVRILIEAEGVEGGAGLLAKAQFGTCDLENTQRLPIRAQNREIGSFWFTPRLDRPLRSRELHFLRLMAVLVGIGVENYLFHLQVAAANEDKRRFILATTHDLRSPVTTIQQLTQVMLEGYAGPLSAKQEDMLKKISARGEHQLQLISDLLLLAAEVTSLAASRERTSVSLAEVFDSQIAAARPGCEAKGITLSAHRDDAPMMRTAVKEDIENVMGNLLSNAVKYTAGAGTVSVDLRQSDGGYRLSVDDTGIGIPKEALPNLFKEYYRAPNAKLASPHGTGLGLALVQKLVQKYGGRIRVDSRLNEGTHFEVFLPAESGK